MSRNPRPCKWCGRPEAAPIHEYSLTPYEPKKRTEPLRVTPTPFGERMRRIKAEQRPALTDDEIERAGVAFLRSYYADVMRPA